MTNRDEFLDWVKTALYEAELALHNGDAGPRRRRRSLVRRSPPGSPPQPASSPFSVSPFRRAVLRLISMACQRHADRVSAAG